GKTIALNDIKGKVTLIDFWAAWCAPCRKENPNVVNVYNKYHEKGLEIIGVSLDGTPQQKDAKQAWMDAIEKDKLTWNHVSNLQYFNDPIAKQFNINSIPATFLIDAEGKIIAKNLRGPALEEKIASLLN
ncbi:MAG: TlpA family protein disulfide reductase, partial [Gammaproteobacteria bacterium]|nr:TlpA family protein disulfide reductase [Gammaproteobacteria bacterium]